MKKRLTKLAAMTALASCSTSTFADTEKLQQAIEAKHRTADYVSRDIYRKPLKTLSLFDIQPDHTVMEVWPGGGWLPRY